MAKTVTVTEIRNTTKGTYDAVSLTGTTTYQGETTEYNRSFPVFHLEKIPGGKDLVSAQPGDVLTLTFDNTKFKNIASVARGTSAIVVPNTSTTTSSSTPKATKEFKLTDESVRSNALLVAAIEHAGGGPVDRARVAALEDYIRHGDRIEQPQTTAVKEENQQEDQQEEGPF